VMLQLKGEGVTYSLDVSKDIAYLFKGKAFVWAYFNISIVTSLLIWNYHYCFDFCRP